MKSPRKLIPLGAALVVLTLGAAPLLSSAADHIDASAFGSLGTSGGPFNPTSINGERDIADVYAFQGADASRTVLAMTTNPLSNKYGTKFGANVRYIINVDRNGDAVQDLAYVVRFDDGALGHQAYTVTRYTGASARSLVNGNVRGTGSTAGNGTASLNGDGKVFAGVANPHAHLRHVGRHQRFGPDHTYLGATQRGQRMDVRARHARMQHVTDDGHRKPGEILFVMPDGVHVQQALRRVRVSAITGIDDVHMRCNVLGNQVGRAGLAVPHDKQVGSHRTEV